MGDLFQRYSAYYNLLYEDKNYIAEAEYVSRTLRKAEPGVIKVLEFGSGTGRHGRLLAERDFKVFGVERSESMVVAANQSGSFRAPNGLENFSCIRGDIREVRLDRSFDAVISLFHVISYQTSNDDLVSTFTNAARHLSKAGVFFFDVWHGPAVLKERPSVRVKRVEDENTRLTRIAEPSIDTTSGVVAVHYTMLAESKTDGRLVTFEEEHRMRYLFPTEIEFLAWQSGFRVEMSEEFVTGNDPSESTWGVAYLLRKIS